MQLLDIAGTENTQNIFRAFGRAMSTAALQNSVNTCTEQDYWALTLIPGAATLWPWW